MRSGPVCHLCGEIVPAVTFVCLAEETAETEGTGAPEKTANLDATTAPEEALHPEETPNPEEAVGPEAIGLAARDAEVGLCPDCLVRAQTDEMLMAPVVPIGSIPRRNRPRRAGPRSAPGYFPR